MSQLTCSFVEDLRFKRFLLPRLVRSKRLELKLLARLKFLCKLPELLPPDPEEDFLPEAEVTRLNFVGVEPGLELLGPVISKLSYDSLKELTMMLLSYTKEVNV